MDGSAKWTQSQGPDGILFVTLGSWRAFDVFIHDGGFRASDYIWRGQAKDWPLLPELWRDPKRYSACGYDHPNSLDVHLGDFKTAFRELRQEIRLREPKDDDLWWALGRHHGLATPLLDWTESPLCAAFFAFVEEDGCCDHTRMVYALYRECTKPAASAIGASDERPPKGTGGMGHIVCPPRDDIPRLSAQHGLFTYFPAGFRIDAWLHAWPASAAERTMLFKIRVPDVERFDFLRHLESSGISSRTMYPDLDGAAEYCNLHALSCGTHRLTPAPFTPAPALGGPSRSATDADD
jgi:hypothetical protein